MLGGPTVRLKYGADLRICIRMQQKGFVEASPQMARQ
jgi:hypothetical protein